MIIMHLSILLAYLICHLTCSTGNKYIGFGNSTREKKNETEDSDFWNTLQSVSYMYILYST